MQISRVRRTKDEARASYNRMSRIYDLLAGSSETKFIYLGLELLAVRAGESVLEIGSGTGEAQMELCRQASGQGCINGIDLSPGMLQVAHDRLAKAGLEGQAHMLIGDGARLPYLNHAFSALFMSFTLELFDTPEIPLVLAECLRVLKPGGRLGVVAMMKSEHPGWMERLYEWSHEKLPAYVDCRPIDINGMLQEAGFSIERSLSKNMWGLPLRVVLARKA